MRPKDAIWTCFFIISDRQRSVTYGRTLNALLLMRMVHCAGCLLMQRMRCAGCGQVGRHSKLSSRDQLSIILLAAARTMEHHRYGYRHSLRTYGSLPKMSETREPIENAIA